MDYNDKCKEYLVQIARLSLSGRRQDIQLYIQRIARKLKNTSPDVTDQLLSLLREMPSNSSPFRSENFTTIPVDHDSRLQLIRAEHPVVLDYEPILTEEIQEKMTQIITERNLENELYGAGLFPTKSILFTGKPGVGKTLIARWIALKLRKPLLLLDLSAVMSSFLGRTGTNVRQVLDYAKEMDGVLLLDELDAIAKRRDDIVEIGELKRLVTVLLQEIDDWPSGRFLIAATNHPNLLDPAVWRRFDFVIDLPMPNQVQVIQAISTYLGSDCTVKKSWIDILSHTMENYSYADIEKEVIRMRREAVVHHVSIENVLEKNIRNKISTLPQKSRIKFAVEIVNSGYSQRQANEITGVSRDTIRKSKYNKKASG